MKLSKNFSLGEFTKSQYASRYGLYNQPNDNELDRIQTLVDKVLQPIRDHFGPVIITSGFRSEKVNKGIGGSPNSQHRLGEAADIEVIGVSNYHLAVWIRENLEFDQLILEFYVSGDPNSGWVHVSYREGENRNEVLTASMEDGGVEYYSGLIK